jgi:hypothetical protein
MMSNFAVAQVFSEPSMEGEPDPQFNLRLAECVVCGGMVNKGKGFKVFIRVNQRYPLERVYCKICRGEVERMRREWMERGWRRDND